MARAAANFVCQSCGSAYGKWSGRCDNCGEWNSIVEEAAADATPKGLGAGKGRKLDLVPLDGPSARVARLPTGNTEFDRAAGGGLVPGSAVLIGGDPGIGKSTILLQVAANLARSGNNVAYISGEEAIAQIRMRAERLELKDAPVNLGAETSVRNIITTFDGPDAPQVMVIDSIQTMFVDSLDSAPGSVAQVRASAQELIRFGKRRNVTIILVGHVTKEGQIAGPRILEHMVDTVLYFEGERGHQFRILRAVKNRYGPTDELGVFEMTDRGLMEVANPSALFLSNREGNVAGAAVFAGIEGSRPMLVEVQALVSPSPFSTPRRAVVGWDSGRLAMVIAVLDTRGGLNLSGHDIYLNVAGGLRISEPAADLAVAGALISSLKGDALPDSTVLFGEISLAGEIRPVGQTDARLREAAKLGFKRALLPKQSKNAAASIRLTEVSTVADLLDVF